MPRKGKKRRMITSYNMVRSDQMVVMMMLGCRWACKLEGFDLRFRPVWLVVVVMVVVSLREAETKREKKKRRNKNKNINHHH